MDPMVMYGEEVPAAPVTAPPIDVPTRRAGFLKLVAAGVVGAALTASGFAIGVHRSPSVTTTTAPTLVNSTPVDVAGEPVAQVARAVLPSTVRIETDTGLGSGVIYNSGGLILTAAHVVEGTNAVVVRLADGTRLSGTVLGADTARDVAVVRVNRSGLPAARLARGVKVIVGQMAVAVGSPFGLNDTVTAGIVSATGRVIPEANASIPVIQTDAAVNPGNSGGALADREGRVIGINVAKSQADGVAFAVPIDIALDSADRIARGGSAAPVAFVGVGLTDPTSGPGGALITNVVSGSPADRAGIRTGDLVRAVDGTPIGDADAFVTAIQSHTPGQRATLTLVRGGSTKDVTLVLAGR